MAQIVKFQADDYDQSECIRILEEALATARSGKMVDCAVVTVERDENGPSFNCAYHGEGAYAVLIAGVSGLQFDLHYRRYQEEDE